MPGTDRKGGRIVANDLVAGLYPIQLPRGCTEQKISVFLQNVNPDNDKYVFLNPKHLTLEDILQKSYQSFYVTLVIIDASNLSGTLSIDPPQDWSVMKDKKKKNLFYAIANGTLYFPIWGELCFNIKNITTPDQAGADKADIIITVRQPSAGQQKSTDTDYTVTLHFIESESEIRAFYTDSSLVASGESVHLNWNIAFAGKGEASIKNGDKVLEDNITKATGTVRTGELTANTVFTLELKKNGKVIDSRELTISVAPPYLADFSLKWPAEGAGPSDVYWKAYCMKNQYLTIADGTIIPITDNALVSDNSETIENQKSFSSFCNSPFAQLATFQDKSGRNDIVSRLWLPTKKVESYPVKQFRMTITDHSAYRILDVYWETVEKRLEGLLLTLFDVKAGAFYDFAGRVETAPASGSWQQLLPPGKDVQVQLTGMDSIYERINIVL